MSRYSSIFTHAPAWRPTGRLLCLALAAATLLAVPCTGLAKKPGGGGGGNSTPPACLLFDDHPLHNVGSDVGNGAALYCDDKSAKVAITFGTDGSMILDTNNSNKAGAGRSLYVNFGEEITIIDVEGLEQTFSSTYDLDEMGVLHDASVRLGVGQEDFDLFAMGVGETRYDVNCQFVLQLVFPGERTRTGLRIGLAPTIVGNNRGFPGSDPVSVTYLGDPESDGVEEWIIETSFDNDLDGLVNEDPVDGVDNDEDGYTDEDGEDPGRASVTQAHFAQEPTVGFFDITVGFRLAAPIDPWALLDVNDAGVIIGTGGPHSVDLDALVWQNATARPVLLARFLPNRNAPFLALWSATAINGAGTIVGRGGDGVTSFAYAAILD